MVSILTTHSSSSAVDDRLHQVTTLIITSTNSGISSASGFFFHSLGPRDVSKSGPQWQIVTNTWLVTNRHVILPRLRTSFDGQIISQEILPSKLTFHLRKLEQGRLKWVPINLSTEELLHRTKCHSDPDVDVCVIEIGDILTGLVRHANKDGMEYIPWGGISTKDLPGGENKINVESAEDVIIIGYPRHFYDNVNLFPVIKSGTIASRWGESFRGKPCFLIDGQMFPGSSGSIVVTRPTNWTIIDGQIFTSKDKQFAFLGILSGEWWDESANRDVEISTALALRIRGAVNTGIVWYGNLVDQIIARGSALAPLGPQNRTIQQSR